MRQWTWVAAVFLGLGLGTPAFAQRVVSFGGTGSQAVTNQPIIQPPSRLGSFNLQGLFHPFSASFGGPPTVGRSEMPEPYLFRSTHYDNRLNPFMPVKQ